MRHRPRAASKIIEQELKVSKKLFLFFICIFLFDFIIENHVREKVSQIEKLTKQEKSY